MMNIEAILEQVGVEIPEDKKEEFKKLLHENYKTVKEVDRLKLDIEKYKKEAEDATETLKKFDGVDVEEMKSQIAEWQKRAEDAKADYEKQISERDFNDLLKTAIADAKGKNAKTIMPLLDLDSLKASKNQKEDISKAIKSLAESEDTSFLFEDAKDKPRFTGKKKVNNPGKKYTLAELMQMKNENPDMDISQYM